jgi:hypothetical protein
MTHFGDTAMRSRWIRKFFALSFAASLLGGAVLTSCNVVVDVPGASVDVSGDSVYVGFPGGHVRVDDDGVRIKFPRGSIQVEGDIDIECD